MTTFPMITSPVESGLMGGLLLLLLESNVVDVLEVLFRYTVIPSTLLTPWCTKTKWNQRLNSSAMFSMAMVPVPIRAPHLQCYVTPLYYQYVFFSRNKLRTKYSSVLSDNTSFCCLYIYRRNRGLFLLRVRR